MKKLTFGLIAASLAMALSAPAAYAGGPRKNDDNAKCPYELGGVCYSQPGKKTGCGTLDTVELGGLKWCKLGPKTNPKPVPSLRDQLQFQGRDG